jgi:hypothetical protein
MRITALLGSITTALVAGALMIASSADADATSHLSATSTGGVVTITPDSGWHLNADYPNWALTVGGTTIQKASFQTLSTGTAVVNASKGAATLKGAVCSLDGTQCASITAAFTIN